MAADTTGTPGTKSDRPTTTDQRRPGRDREPLFKRQMGWGASYIGAALLVAWVVQTLVGPVLSGTVEIPYSEFKAKLAAGELADVTVGSTIEGLARSGEPASPP